AALVVSRQLDIISPHAEPVALGRPVSAAYGNAWAAPGAGHGPGDLGPLFDLLHQHRDRGALTRRWRRRHDHGRLPQIEPERAPTRRIQESQTQHVAIIATRGACGNAAR